MGAERGELNIGQLCRQAYGSQAALIGFGTHSGTVAAAMEGTLEGLPAMAISSACFKWRDFEGAGRLAVDVAEAALADGWPDNLLLILSERISINPDKTYQDNYPGNKRIHKRFCQKMMAQALEHP